MKRKKIPDLLIILLFIALVAAPVSMSLVGSGEDGKDVEKRAMAQLPASDLLWSAFPDFTVRFERYYNDSFGLRNQLIRWNNLFRLKLLGDSPVKTVRPGRDGWLFYAGEWVLEDYANVMPYREDELARIARGLEERRAWLERRGITFFIVVAPNKHTIYPEYLPSSVRKIGERSRLDQVTAYLRGYPGIEFIDLRGALLEEKGHQRLYHRTDTHWNDYGAFIGYEKVMERIERILPHVRKLSRDDYRVVVEEGKGGDLAGLLSLSEVIREERINLVPLFTPRAVDGARDYADPVQHPGRERVVKETGDARLPKALVFRDSFSWPLIPYFAESFRSAVFLWTFDFLPEVIEREQPDVVILECVERYLNALMIENPKEVALEPGG